MPSDCTGFLQLKRNKAGALATTYYFELRGTILYYWQTKGDSGAPIAAITLSGAQIKDSPGPTHEWTVDCVSRGKVYTLAANSESEKRMWMEKMMNLNEQHTDHLNVQRSMSDDDEPGHAVFSRTSKKVSRDDFRTVAVLGRGVLGETVLVEKKGKPGEPGQLFAMKTVKKKEVENENMFTQISQERHILQQIDHPFIVKLHYAFQDSNNLYLVLSLLSGGELFHYLGEVVQFPEERAKFYTANVGLAIGYLHSKNIMYRDLKPENALLDSEGYVCLTDFNLSKSNVSEANANTFCGTPEYIAPELLLGNPHGKPVDWWALGTLLYEMLFGIPPFYSDNQSEMYDLILKSELNFPADTPISDEAKDILHRLLTRDPEKRMQDIDEFKKHPFFKSIDFDRLYRRELPPPFRPDTTNILQNFDEQFTSEPPPTHQGGDREAEVTIADYTYEADAAYQPAPPPPPPTTAKTPAAAVPAPAASTAATAPHATEAKTGHGTAAGSPTAPAATTTATKGTSATVAASGGKPAQQVPPAHHPTAGKQQQQHPAGKGVASPPHPSATTKSPGSSSTALPHGSTTQKPTTAAAAAGAPKPASPTGGKASASSSSLPQGKETSAATRPSPTGVKVAPAAGGAKSASPMAGKSSATTAPKS